MPERSARALFAARLAEARQLRGLSQRALGDRMGLGKDKGSVRINRYERQVTAIGFESLDALAQALDVPPAYLLADSPDMAEAIRLLAAANPQQQALMLEALRLAIQDPEALARLVDGATGPSPT